MRPWAHQDEYEHDWDGAAAREYARAMQLDPALASAYHRRGLLYAMQGDTDRALAETERAQQLEPLWLAPKGAAGNFLYLTRRYDESIRFSNRCSPSTNARTTRAPF